MINKLNKYNLKIRGCTKKGFGRTEEINEYVSHYKIQDYIILDDDLHLFSDKKNLYHVNCKTGLTKSDIKGIKKFLKKRC